MATNLVKKFRQGAKLLSAAFREHLNELVDGVNRAQVYVAPGSGLVAQQGPNGVTLASTVQPEFWGHVTALVSGSSYTVVERQRTASSTWQDGARTVTAIEVNGNTSVTTDGTVYVRVRLSRTSAEWLFQASSC